MKIKKNNDNFAKQYKGITLIALVITIVILLILAGITISQLTDSGLFNKSNMAKTESDKSKALEELKLLVLELQIEKKGVATLQDVVNKLQEDVDNEYKIYLEESSAGDTVTEITDDTKEIYVTYKGFQFKIDNKLDVTSVDNKVDSEIETELEYDDVVEVINSKEEFSKLLETERQGYLIWNI